MVLGYPFLARYDPVVDWNKRTLTLTSNGTRYFVQGQPTGQTFATSVGTVPEKDPQASKDTLMLHTGVLSAIPQVQLYPLEWEEVPAKVRLNPQRILAEEEPPAEYSIEAFWSPPEPVDCTHTRTLKTDVPEVACSEMSVIPAFSPSGFLAQINPQPLVEEFVLSPAEREEIELLAEPRTSTISRQEALVKPVAKIVKTIDHSVCGHPVTKRPLPEVLLPVPEWDTRPDGCG